MTPITDEQLPKASAWAMTDYQQDGPNVQFTTDPNAAEHYAGAGICVEPLYTTGQLREALTALAAERDEAIKERKYFADENKLLTHKLITCGVAAHNPDPARSSTGSYGGKWDSPQAQDVRKLRAERDALRAIRSSVDHIAIDDAPKLDQINVFLQDLSPGCGRITIECYGLAWSAYFGGLGGRTIKQFVAAADADYLSGKLETPKMSKSDKNYLHRIAHAVIDHVHAEMKGVRS